MDGPAPSGPHLSSVPGRAGADLVAVLAEAADLSGDVAAIDATELGFELLPLIGRDLADRGRRSLPRAHSERAPSREG